MQPAQKAQINKCPLSVTDWLITIYSVNCHLIFLKPFPWGYLIRCHLFPLLNTKSSIGLIKSHSPFTPIEQVELNRFRNLTWSCSSQLQVTVQFMSKCGDFINFLINCLTCIHVTSMVSLSACLHVKLSFMCLPYFCIWRYVIALQGKDREYWQCVTLTPTNLFTQNSVILSINKKSFKFVDLLLQYYDR